jgi:hypothetical protein
VGLPRLRLRGVLPHLLRRRRPGHAGRRAGEHRPRELRSRPEPGGLRGRRPQGHARLLPGRPLQRAPQLHGRLHQVPEPARGAEGTAHLPPAQPPVAVQPAATATRPPAMRSSTATSTPTSPRACGSSGASTTPSKRGRSWR